MARKTAPSTDYDIAVIGAGAAGLSLGQKLKNQESSVVFIEPRASYINDRTWCFWDEPNHDLCDITRHSWPEISFEKDGHELVYKHPHRPYHCIMGKDFYSYALDKIKRNPQCHLKLDTQVESIEAIDKRFNILTNDGAISVRYIVDTRPPPPGSFKKPFLFQQFAGVEVETKDRLFDPKIAGLMRHLKADDNGIGFIYILPFSGTNALIEWTRFTPSRLSDDSVQKELEACLEKISPPKTYKITRHEIATIPMGFPKCTPPHKDIFLAGTRGGAVKASTGYAFQRIQRWAYQCAQSIRATGRPISHPPDKVMRAWMDKIFLKVLIDQPELGPTIKMNLVSGLSADQFIRFMSDDASLKDNLAIIKSQPFWPFTKAAVKDLIGL